MTGTSENPGTAVLSRAREGGRVLIVDDRPEKLLTLEAALGSLEREIVTVGSGREALRRLLHEDFAVILLDVNMPGMDGFETARLIRQRPRNRHIPIIFVTAYGDDLHALEAYALGAVDFILSPVVPEVLCSKVGVLLTLRECTIEIKKQADRLRQHARQLQALTQASLAIHAAPTVDRILQVAVDAAREVTECEYAATMLAGDQSPAPGQPFFSRVDSSRTVLDSPTKSELAEMMAGLLEERRRSSAARSGSVRRLSAPPGRNGTRRAALAVPLLGRESNPIGILLAARGPGGMFTGDDSGLLMQLAQMASTAIENTLFAEAREANRLKDEFLATLSHELRTPLSAILGWAQLLRTHTLDPAETAEALEIIERNGEMQHRLVEDLLDVSRIITGKMQINLRPISLLTVVRAAADVVLPAAQSRRIAIEVALEDREDLVVGDPDRLQQAVWNLLSNAVKFTPPGGRVDVRLRVDSGEAELAVQDTGEGISAEFLPHVFERFRQADSSTSRRHGGLGIGLAIVRHVVDLHGGTVRAESEGKGHGTTIMMRLPLAPDHRHATPAEASLERCGEVASRLRSQLNPVGPLGGGSDDE